MKTTSRIATYALKMAVTLTINWLRMMQMIQTLKTSFWLKFYCYSGKWLLQQTYLGCFEGDGKKSRLENSIPADLKCIFEF